MLVFTNGVFDILHRGHVAYLGAARSLGDRLVVGINSDKSARSLGKGADRPINSQIDRAAVVGALRCVDQVIIFDEPDPLKLLAVIRPDIYVKGGDYIMADLKETALLYSWGGKAMSTPFLEGYSSSAIINRIKGLWY